MIEPAGISHYGICVRDLDRSLAFYRDILGMKCGPIREQNMAEHFGDRQAQVYQKPRQSRRAASLTWGDDSKPWLVLSSHDDTPVEGDAPKLDQVGIHHICFSVKDPHGFGQPPHRKWCPVGGFPGKLYQGRRQGPCVLCFRSRWNPGPVRRRRRYRVGANSA